MPASPPEGEIDYSRYLNIYQAAHHLQTNPSTLHKWIAKGCPCHRSKRKVFFLAQELDQWMKTQRRISRNKEVSGGKNLLSHMDQ